MEKQIIDTLKEIAKELKRINGTLAQTPADVAEVRHGRWCATIFGKTDKALRVGAPHCSECEATAPRRSAFCPNCGAKMDSESREES